MSKRSTKVQYLDDEQFSVANQNHSQGLRQQPKNRIAPDHQRNTAAALLETEAQVLLSLLAGKENAQIADGLAIDQTAVKDHIKSILRKTRTRFNKSADQAS